MVQHQAGRDREDPGAQPGRAARVEGGQGAQDAQERLLGEVLDQGALPAQHPGEQSEHRPLVARDEHRAGVAIAALGPGERELVELRALVGPLRCCHGPVHALRNYTPRAGLCSGGPASNR
jgi:hypothetical protein